MPVGHMIVSRIRPDFVHPRGGHGKRLPVEHLCQPGTGLPGEVLFRDGADDAVTRRPPRQRWSAGKGEQERDNQLLHTGSDLPHNLINSGHT